jgi:hypothetical protein
MKRTHEICITITEVYLDIQTNKLRMIMPQIPQESDGCCSWFTSRVVDNITVCIINKYNIYFKYRNSIFKLEQSQ